MFVTCYVISIGRSLSPMDKGCFGMVSVRKLVCTEAAKDLSGTLGRGWVHSLARWGVEATL